MKKITQLAFLLLPVFLLTGPVCAEQAKPAIVWTKNTGEELYDQRLQEIESQRQQILEQYHQDNTFLDYKFNQRLEMIKGDPNGEPFKEEKRRVIRDYNAKKKDIINEFRRLSKILQKKEATLKRQHLLEKKEVQNVAAENKTP